MKILKKIFKIIIILILIFCSISIIGYIGLKAFLYFNDPKVTTFTQNKCIMEQKKECNIDLQKYEGRNNFDIKIIEKKLNYFCVKNDYGFNCTKE